MIGLRGFIMVDNWFIMLYNINNEYIRGAETNG